MFEFSKAWGALRVSAAALFTLTASATSAATAPLIPLPPNGIAPRAAGLGVDELDQRQADALAALRGNVSGRPLVARFERGSLHFLHGSIPAPGVDAPSRARSFLDGYGKDLLRLGPNSELRLLRTNAATGLAAFRQRYRGLPVMGASLQVLTGPDGVHAVIGSVMPGDGFDVTPTFDEHEILQEVEKHGGTLLAPPQLAVSYRREAAPSGAGVPGPLVRTPRLVWIVPCIKEGDGHTMIYDAHSGEVLREVSMAMDSQAAIDEYDADWNDANQGPTLLCQGAAVENVNAGDDNGLFTEYYGLPEYFTAWTHTRRAFAFFYDVFGRVSFDDDDATVYGYNESPDTPYAHFVPWCDDIHWGPGYGSTDVPVHEFTHGVTSYTSDLVYQDEPGALNESFSDIMTAVADNDGDSRWLIGENNIDGSGAIRDMQNPMIGHYSNFWSTEEDDGGVHRNSGIGNKAAFLLAEGRHEINRYPVDGIGVSKMGRVMYAAFTSLGDEANYDDLRNMAVAFADYWADHGLRGFTPQDVCSVRNAFALVGVDGKAPDYDAYDTAGGDANCDGIDDADTGDDPDADGIDNFHDNCDYVSNPSQTDTDDGELNPDNLGDACDPDDDEDLIPDTEDNCPTEDNYDQQDGDSDGRGDRCDDSDGDGDLDDRDNCPTVYNPDQKDTGGLPGFGDACDGDADGDGVFNADGDNCPLVANADQADADGDFFGDVCDGCPNAPAQPAAFGFDGRPLQPDSDGDGTPDQCDGSLKADGPSSGKIVQGQTPQPMAFAFSGAPRVTLPLSLCPEPCVANASARLVGKAYALDLASLPAGITAMVTDEKGNARSRAKTLPDGSQRLYFRPFGDRRYFLTLMRSANAPSNGEFSVRSFLQAPTLVSPADLSVSVADSPDPVVSGSELRYTVEAANDTFSTAEGVELRLTLPAGAQLKSAPGCESIDGELRCDVGDLAAGARVHRKVFVTASGCPNQPLSFSARVQSGTVDPVPENDVAGATTQVIDGTGPAISVLNAKPEMLWPPDHRMRTVDVTATVADACDTRPRCRITGVTSNEVLDGSGDGRTAADWQIVDADTVSLRAERSGQGSGREYYVAMECADAAGNTTRRTATVRVTQQK